MYERVHANQSNVYCCALRLGMVATFVVRQVGGLAQEADYEYLGQDGFCHDRKHGGLADSALTRLKVSSGHSSRNQAGACGLLHSGPAYLDNLGVLALDQLGMFCCRRA